MSKKENHKQDLINLFDGYLKTGDQKKILEYLISNSNLPGRRANLELAEAFTEAVEKYFPKDPNQIWDMCLKFSEISSYEANVNDPKEFLPFCGAWAIGSIGSVSSTYFDKSLIKLKELANDPRWRMRESVAKGIQKLIINERKKTLKHLEDWITNNNWLEMRAVAAGVAEPHLLQDEKIAKQALELHKNIFEQIISTRERKSEEFIVLKKALGYTLSVVIFAMPNEGFEFSHRLIESNDSDVLWIVKQNMKKNRLIKNFPKDVTLINNMLK
jgi:3-methyladenine DNA glycosylase AlkC